MWQQQMIRVLSLAVSLAGAATRCHAADAKDAKRSGSVDGILTEKKLDNPPGKGWWIKVKGDGEEEPRRYWGYGGKPAADVQKVLNAAPLGSRVRVSWKSEGEGPHIAKLELLKAAATNKEKPKDKVEANKTGTVVGVLIDRTYGKGVLVKADGEESPRRYWRFGDRPALNKEIDAVPIGSRVSLTWEVPHANEGPHVAKIEILRAADKQPAGKSVPSLEETLTWLKKMPTMSRSAIGPKMERDCFQKLSVADLKTLKELHIGGHLVKDGKLQPGHVEFPADEYRHLTALPALEKLGFMENGLGDAALVHIGKIGTLTKLTFGDHEITDAGLKHLAILKKLTYLNLCFPDKKHGGVISDKGLDEIAKLAALEILDLRATQITDAGLAKLRALPKLKELLVNNTAITDKGLDHLHALKSLRLVSVFNCKGVTPNGMALLKKALPECEVRTTAK